MTPERPPLTGTPLADLAIVLGRMATDGMALAKAEMTDGVRRLVGGIAFLVVAVLLLFVALMLLGQAGAAGLVAIGVHPALAPALVGGALLLLAVGSTLWGLSYLRSFRLFPVRTVARLRRDLHMIKEMMSHDSQT